MLGFFHLLVIDSFVLCPFYYILIAFRFTLSGNVINMQFYIYINIPQTVQQKTFERSTNAHAYFEIQLERKLCQTLSSKVLNNIMIKKPETSLIQIFLKYIQMNNMQPHLVNENVPLLFQIVKFTASYHKLSCMYSFS